MPNPIAEHRIPGGHRVYAVGDVHGRADLLARLMGMIGDDAAQAGNLVRTLVFLGDYVDRGPSTREVLDLLLDTALDGFACVHLMGNHEAMMLDFIDGGEGDVWMVNGGDATLRSYGLDPEGAVADRRGLPVLRRELRDVLPRRHLDFLRNLSRYHAVGGYLFAHAGIRPGVPLADQSSNDLLWIRHPFLADETAHAKTVVHGHTVTPEPVSRPNRIGIDTGAWRTGRLTCVVLEGARRRFFSTGGEQ